MAIHCILHIHGVFKSHYACNIQALQLFLSTALENELDALIATIEEKNNGNCKQSECEKPYHFKVGCNRDLNILHYFKC